MNLDTAPPPRRVPRLLWLGLKVVVSVGLLVALALTLDLRAAGTALLSVAPWAVAVSIVLYSVQAVLVAIRWWLTGRRLGSHLTLPGALRLSYVGLFLSTCLPSSAGGDPVRIFMTWRRGVAMRVAVMAVLIDRGVGVLCLFLLSGLAPLLVPEAVLAPGGQSLWLLPVFAGLAIAGTAALTAADRLPLRFLGQRIQQAIEALASDMRAVFLHGPTTAAVMAIGLIGHGTVALAVWVLAVGMDVAVTVPQAVALVPLSILVQLFPVSLGGWGVREAMLVAAFGLIGVAAPDALAISVLSGVVFTLSSLPGLILWQRAPSVETPSKDDSSDTLWS